jgi:acyl-CoA thioester hydrolase
MYQHKTKTRVLYADTDLMGYVYYGNYPKFYEIGRTEMVRELGIPYAELEKRGVMMPVRDMQCNYIKPTHYDQVLTIQTSVKELPKARMKFYYEIFNEEGELVHTGETTLIFLDMKTNRPVRAPQLLLDKLRPYFE